jgi:hypothetical protein
MTCPTKPLVLLAATLLLAGCGSSNGSNHSADGDPSGDAVAVSSATPTAGATGDGSLPEDVCRSLSATDVAKVLGGKVTLETAPGGDCSFQQDDLRAISGGLGVVTAVTPDSGYDSYLAGLNATMTSPDRHDLTGVGDHAAVLIGIPQMGSGENLIAAGAVDKGDHLLTVTLAQGKGESADRLLTVATDLLELIAESIG